MTETAIQSADRAETEKIAALVERYLERHQPKDYRLVVRRNHIRLGRRRWLVEVGVEPARAGISTADFVDRIAGANEDLDRDFPRYVRLSTMVPSRDELL